MNIEAMVFVAVVLLLVFVSIIPIWPWNRKHSRHWTAHTYYGAGKVTLGKMTRLRAVEYITKNFGVVTYVDNDHGFIFYKPRSEIK